MININIEKAKQIAHQMRRNQRQKEFAPLDDLISKNIPGIDFSEIEKERQTIREKYAQIQINIDSALTVDQIKVALCLP